MGAAHAGTFDSIPTVNDDDDDDDDVCSNQLDEGNLI